MQIEWDTDPGTREVQWIKTYADTGPNEIQSITTTADDVDEVQQLIISANETREVQVSKGAACCWSYSYWLKLSLFRSSVGQETPEVYVAIMVLAVHAAEFVFGTRMLVKHQQSDKATMLPPRRLPPERTTSVEA